ncbi:MotE family protein [Natronospora cellulosivora (SeqCode)]
MKKFIYITLTLIILFAIIWILNTFAIISLRSWGENIITNTPFLQDYVETNQAYSEIEGELNELTFTYQEVEQERDQLLRDSLLAENMINEKTKKIEELEERLKLLQSERYSEEEKFDKLVGIYGEMRARDAAPIFLELDDDLAIELLMNIDEEQAAEILTSLPAEDAARYSRALR